MKVTPQAAPTGDRSVQEAARGLESYFVKEWLKTAKVGEGLGLGKGVAASTFEEMLQDSLAQAVSSAGGLGVSEALAAQLVAPESVQAYRAQGVQLGTSPIAGRITSDFGIRSDPIHGGERAHHGIDLAAPAGTPVQAAGAGVVRFAGEQSGYGNVVILDHGGGLETRYAHLQDVNVQEGATLSEGQSLGTVGSTGRSTGPHLHFEVRQDGQPQDPTSRVPALNEPQTGSRWPLGGRAR